MASMRIFQNCISVKWVLIFVEQIVLSTQNWNASVAK